MGTKRDVVATAELPSESPGIRSSRFEVRRCLGRGGFGAVYEAFDRRERALIAVKLLERTNADAVLAFKREFRELVDVRHPNLVALRELLYEDDQWLLCMELVQGGTDVVSFVRPEGRAGECDEARVRHVFAQTVEALMAIHAAGKVHRDIKPSNIRVTPEGRAVVIDFGLVSEAGESESNIAGTLMYMAPEQSLSDPLTSAADYFALGMVLYEALTGKLPFDGASLDVMMQKQRGPMCSPAEIRPHVPQNLSDLCMRLLSPQPRARPTGEQILSVLKGDGVPHSSLIPFTSGTVATFSAELVGRGDEIAHLDRALLRMRAGKLATLSVFGESGIGKTRLVTSFLDRVRLSDERLLVLRARCYENETVAYKALDGIIDALGRELRKLPEETCRALLPPRAGLLPLIFPALSRVPTLSEMSVTTEGASDRLALRAMVFGALRELLVRVADDRPVVLFIDDLQWADGESMALLSELLRPPRAPRVLLVTASRPRDACSPEVLRGVEMILQADERSEALELRRLAHDDAVDLALSLMNEPSEPWADLIAREAEGHPLFVELLVRHSEDIGEAPTLERAILERVRRVDANARKILELCCLAGVPIPRLSLEEVCDLSADEFARELSILRVARLVRTTRVGSIEHIEPFHDRIRTTISTAIPEDQERALHRRIALALEVLPNADRERVAIHWLKAGSAERAARAAALAGDQANEALAFQKAARMYRWAMEQAPEPRSKRDLCIKLAEALANAGHCSEAADLVLEASEDAPAGESIELRRRAAELLFQSGRLETGRAIARALLDSVGLKLPETRAEAIRRMVFLTLRRKLRGEGFVSRPAAAVPHDELARVDVLWSLSSTLGPIDHFVGAALQCEHYLHALSAGEPSRIAQAMAMDCMGQVFIGRRKGVVERFETPRALANESGRPDVQGLVDYLEGGTRGMLGEWQEAMPLLERAEKRFSEECSGVAWLLTTARVSQLLALFELGRWDELALRFPRAMLDAEERGDPYLRAQTLLACAFAYHLMHDRPDRARSALNDAKAEQIEQGTGLFQRWFAALSIGTYAGEDGCFEHAQQALPFLRRSGCMRMPGVDLSIRLRAGLAAVAQVKRSLQDPMSAMRIAEREVKALRTGADPTSSRKAGELLLSAAICDARGKQTESIGLFEQAEHIAKARGRKLYEDVARVRRGQLLGGAAGESIVDEATHRLRSQGVKRPLAFLDAMLPGILEI